MPISIYSSVTFLRKYFWWRRKLLIKNISRDKSEELYHKAKKDFLCFIKIFSFVNNLVIIEKAFSLASLSRILKENTISRKSQNLKRFFCCFEGKNPKNLRNRKVVERNEFRHGIVCFYKEMRKKTTFLPRDTKLPFLYLLSLLKHLQKEMLLVQLTEKHGEKFLLCK